MHKSLDLYEYLTLTYFTEIKKTLSIKSLSVKQFFKKYKVKKIPSFQPCSLQYDSFANMNK